MVRITVCKRVEPGIECRGSAMESGVMETVNRAPKAHLAPKNKAVGELYG